MGLLQYLDIPDGGNFVKSPKVTWRRFGWVAEYCMMGWLCWTSFVFAYWFILTTNLWVRLAQNCAKPLSQTWPNIPYLSHKRCIIVTRIILVGEWLYQPAVWWEVSQPPSGAGTSNAKYATCLSRLCQICHLFVTSCDKYDMCLSQTVTNLTSVCHKLWQIFQFFSINFASLYQGEFWWGNDFISQLSGERSHSLRVELEAWDGRRAHANYATFRYTTV